MVKIRLESSDFLHPNQSGHSKQFARMLHGKQPFYRLKTVENACIHKLADSIYAKLATAVKDHLIKTASDLAR